MAYTTPIHFDYDFSPYGQKTKWLLTAAGIDFVKVDQPSALPRPDLLELGITYRRIPLLAIGKDIYADSNLVIDKALSLAKGKLPTSPADQAYKEWADVVFNNDVLGLIPEQVLTPEFLKDREGIFHMLQRPDIKTLRPSALAQFRSRLRQVEHQFLSSSSGPFINGPNISVADIHLIWPIKFAFVELGIADEPGFGKQEFPKTHKLVDSLPKFDPKVISAEEAWKSIREGQYTSSSPTEVEDEDPLTTTTDKKLRVTKGVKVTVESFDSTPGSSPQEGWYFGSNEDEFVIEIKDDVRLHFPRIGYIVRPA